MVNNKHLNCFGAIASQENNLFYLYLHLNKFVFPLFGLEKLNLLIVFAFIAVNQSINQSINQSKSISICIKQFKSISVRQLKAWIWAQVRKANIYLYGPNTKK